MARPKRTLEGVFYAHSGGQLFAFLQTDQPYGIPELSALMRRAQECSNGKVGTLAVKIFDDPRSPDKQGLAVISSGTNVNHRKFAQAIGQLFDGSGVTAGWVTSLPMESVYAYVAQRLLSL